MSRLVDQKNCCVQEINLDQGSAHLLREKRVTPVGVMKILGAEIRSQGPQVGRRHLVQVEARCDVGH